MTGGATLPAISLHQPWATLCVTPVSCDCEWDQSDDCLIAEEADRMGGSYCDVITDGQGHGMVKRYETRNRKPPSTIVGRRVILHATLTKPVSIYEADLVASRTTDGDHGLTNYERGGDDWIALPLGAIVGSAIIGEGVPIETPASEEARAERIVWTSNAGDLKLAHIDRYIEAANDGRHPWITDEDISDQLPYGDWTPGRWAWPLTDARPITEWCPWCDGTGLASSDPFACPACEGLGRFDRPPQFKGRRGVFYIEAGQVTA